MAKRKLFGRSKSKKENKEIDIPIDIKETLQPEQEIISETNEEAEELPITEYHETLYSKESAPKKSKAPSKASEETWKRKSWESVGTIEKNVDHIKQKKAVGTSDYKQKSSNIKDKDIDKKVDRLFSKKKL